MSSVWKHQTTTRLEGSQIPAAAPPVGSISTVSPQRLTHDRPKQAGMPSTFATREKRMHAAIEGTAQQHYRDVPSHLPPTVTTLAALGLTERRAEPPAPVAAKFAPVHRGSLRRPGASSSRGSVSPRRLGTPRQISQRPDPRWLRPTDAAKPRRIRSAAGPGAATLDDGYRSARAARIVSNGVLPASWAGPAAVPSSDVRSALAGSVAIASQQVSRPE